MYAEHVYIKRKKSQLYKPTQAFNSINRQYIPFQKRFSIKINQREFILEQRADDCIFGLFRLLHFNVSYKIYNTPLEPMNVIFTNINNMQNDMTQGI